jgi:hypothetical protein
LRYARLAAASILVASPAFGEDSSHDLATKLANPVASLISVPFQFNYDCCSGISDGQRITLNIQPVVPFALDDHWNLIVRTIMPLIDQGEPAPGVGSHSGLGDTTQSFFFSPTTEPGGIIWAVGPAFLWPTATDSHLGTRQWSAGPTVLVLQQRSGWTYGLLANHVWSFAGEDDHPNVSSTFLQPFLSYTWPDSTGVTIQSETTYDWTAETWTVPINLQLSHVYNFGHQPVSLLLGGRWYATRPNDGPTWGLRFAVTFLFPK